MSPARSYCCEPRLPIRNPRGYRPPRLPSLQRRTRENWQRGPFVRWRDRARASRHLADHQRVGQSVADVAELPRSWGRALGPKGAGEVYVRRGIGIDVKVSRRYRAWRLDGRRRRRSGHREIIGGGNREGRHRVGALARKSRVGGRVEAWDRARRALQNRHSLSDDAGVTGIEPGLVEIVLHGDVALLQVGQNRRKPPLLV